MKTDSLSGYLGSMDYTYWDSVGDAHRAINAFMIGFRCDGRCDDPRYLSEEGHTVLTYVNDRVYVYVSFAWYTMQSGRKEITVYTC